jgi:hypothetical protein
MENYEELIAQCQSNSKLASSVIDDFLMYYAGIKLNLSKVADKNLGVYNHITRNHKEWLSLFKSQYIVHHIFKKGGVGKKLLNHSTVKEQLDQEELTFFQQQIDNPWKFSFSEIVDNPKENFFKMYDVFTQEEFLLYSPSVQDITNENSIQLWLNLIQYNGSCWQSFGPIGSYSSFKADDIYFFATELDPTIVTDQDILNHIEYNPAPYMMLFSGSRYPEIYSKNHLTIHARSIFDDVQIDFEKLKEYFEIESNSNIYRFKAPKLHSHPHFAVAYYDGDTKELIFEAMTGHGFIKIVKLWNKAGYNLRPVPDLCVRPSMLTTTKKITGKNAEILAYDKYFDTEDEVTEAEANELKKINDFMKLVVPMVNSGEKPDIAKLAKKANLEASVAEQVFEQIKGQIEKLDKR